MIRLCLALLLLCCALDARAASRRIAVVVGANAAPAGRTPLRYAHEDARAFARMLIDVGDFRPGDVHVLLDPAPKEVLRLLDEAAWALARTEEPLLLFYYSGHADHGALFPGGAPLPLADLKARLDAEAAGVRLGIVDACRGGAWTGAKGLVPDAPFDVERPLDLGAEGSVLVASSSGLEDAHEAEAIGGSFFTHHLIAGLRGAADRSGDGTVTVTEAFEYARRLTIRDSALHARRPQTPSFDLKLRGRTDLALTRIDAGPSRVSLRQAEGPLQVIRLDTGLVVVELPPGRQETMVALAPGDYLVRRRREGVVWAREVALAPGVHVQIGEEELDLVGTDLLAAKSVAPLQGSTTLPAGAWELRAAVGRVYDETSLLFTEEREARGHTGFDFALTVGLTDRIAISLDEPGVAWRLGEAGDRELLLHASVPFGFGTSSVEGGFGRLLPVASATGRLYFGPRQSLLLGAGVQTALSWARGEDALFEAWRLEAQAGYVLLLGDAVTLAFGASAGQRFADGQLVTTTRPGVALQFGSALRLGTRPLPLVQIHALDWFSLDGYASVGWDVPAGTLHEQYLGGLTLRW